jgi:hypothetical protein
MPAAFRDFLRLLQPGSPDAADEHDDSTRESDDLR